MGLASARRLAELYRRQKNWFATIVGRSGATLCIGTGGILLLLLLLLRLLLFLLLLTCGRSDVRRPAVSLRRRCGAKHVGIRGPRMKDLGSNGRLVPCGRRKHANGLSVRRGVLLGRSRMNCCKCNFNMKPIGSNHAA